MSATLKRPFLLKKYIEKCLTPFAILLCGIFVGWLAGLSVSPVLQIILTSLLALAISVISLLIGIRPRESGSIILSDKLKNSVNPFPLVFLAIGISTGATFGLYARTNSFFGVDAKHLKADLEKAGFSSDSATKYVQAYVIGLLFEKEKAVPPIDKKETEKVISHLGSNPVLYASNSTFCDIMRSKHGKDLLGFLKAQQDSNINKFLVISQDSISIEALKNFLCK